MAKELKELTKDQERRIFRDFLKGVPKEKILKKNDIDEGVLKEIIGLYGKRKHPNDVGNAQDIEGPLDLLVTRLDTGSTATENPVVARNPRDLRVAVDRPLQEYDYNGPEEKARLALGEATDAITKRNDEARKAETELVKDAIEQNKEATDAALKELSDESASQKEALATQAIEAAEAVKDPEVLRREARESAERAVIAENVGELLRTESVQKHAEENRERDAELVKVGKEQNEAATKAEAEARQKETDKRLEELRAQQKRTEREGEAAVRTSGGPDSGKRGQAGVSSERAGSTGSTGDNQPSRAGTSGDGTPSGKGPSPSRQGASNDPDASTAGDPRRTVEPAKVDIAGLTKTEDKK